MTVSIKTGVVLETTRHRITGYVAVPEGERLSDYCNDPGRTFFAIVDAAIAPIDQPDRMRSIEFVLVNRAEAGLITPGDTVQEPAAPVWDDAVSAAFGIT